MKANTDTKMEIKQSGGAAADEPQTPPKSLPALKSVIVLTTICLLVACILGAVNHVTASIIEKADQKAENEALRTVLPLGENFEKMNPDATLPASVIAVFREAGGKGYVFRMQVTGYASGLSLMCGVSPEGRITGAVCLASNETLGAEKLLGERFVGMDASTVGTVDTVAGATLTSRAYRSAMADALAAFAALQQKAEV